MGWIVTFAKSSIGAKIIMALTGALLAGFVFAHMAGNLLLFAGPEALNSYAKRLKDLGPLLWIARGGLLLVFVVHIASAVRLGFLDRTARPQRYQHNATIQTTLAARTMILSGLLLLAFVVFHLLHFTLGVTHPEHFAQVDSLGNHDVYNMVVRGFQQPLVSASYIVAMVLLGMHLSHGVSSMFQS
ncbi:MAG: succinate dehydrogenase cytochrome b subunit [Myxococcota bacterium]